MHETIAAWWGHGQFEYRYVPVSRGIPEVMTTGKAGVLSGGVFSWLREGEFGVIIPKRRVLRIDSKFSANNWIQKFAYPGMLEAGTCILFYLL